MKLILLPSGLLALLLFGASKPQEKRSFEGTVVYKIEVKSKSPNISTDRIQQLYGSRMVFSIQGDKYRMSHSGTDLKEVFYLGDTNSQYTLRKGIDTLFVENCAKEDRKLTSSTIGPTTNLVLGHKCHTLINDFGTTSTQYWFDPAIYINPNSFRNHAFGFTNLYYEKSKSLWLKYKYEGQSFTLTFTAVDIQEHQLDRGVFQLPNLPKKRWAAL